MWNTPMKLFEFGPVVQEKVSFKDISYPELWPLYAPQSKTIFASLVEGIMGNISVKLRWIRTSDLGGGVL